MREEEEGTVYRQLLLQLLFPKEETITGMHFPSHRKLLISISICCIGSLEKPSLAYLWTNFWLVFMAIVFHFCVFCNFMPFASKN